MKNYSFFGQQLTLTLLLCLFGTLPVAAQRVGIPSNSTPPPPKESSGRPGLTGRPGLYTSAGSRPGLERNQRIGIQQTGETLVTTVKRNIVPKPANPTAKADGLLNGGNFLAAQKNYLEVLEKNNCNVDAQIGLGVASINLGDYETAISACEKALQCQPNKNDEGEARNTLALALYRQGRIEDAIREYAKALELLPNANKNPDIYFNLAVAYAHNGDLEKAVDNYQQAIKQKNGSYPEAYNNLGLVYEAMDNVEKSRESFRQAIAQNKDYEFAYYNLARSYQTGGNTVEEYKQNLQVSIDNYKKALAISKAKNLKFAEAHLALANIYLITGRQKDNIDMLNEAIKQYQEAIDARNGVYPLAHENLAVAYRSTQQDEAVLDSYLLAFSQYDGLCPLTLSNLISYLSDQPFVNIQHEANREDIAGNLKKAKKLANNTQFNNQLRAELMRKLSDYNKLDEEQKNQAIARYCAGRSYAAVGNSAAALQELLQALKLAKEEKEESDDYTSQDDQEVLAKRAILCVVAQNSPLLIP